MAKLGGRPMKGIWYFVIAVFSLMVAVTGVVSIAEAFYAPYEATVWVEGTTVHYQVYDEINETYREETWILSEGDEAAIESLQVNSGIVAWIAKYKYHDQTDYTYAVHYRVFDPTREMWQSDFAGVDQAGWFGEGYGFKRKLHNMTVRDGVVVWQIQYMTAVEPLHVQYGVCYVAYDPMDGVWKFERDLFKYIILSGCRPELLRVDDGVLAWGEPCKDDYSPVFVRTYDQEVHRWAKGQRGTMLPYRDLDEIEIANGTVHAHSGFWFGPDFHNFFVYDPHNHKWSELIDFEDLLGNWNWPDPIPKASFVAQPTSEFVPFWTTFWDTSFPNHIDTTWSWNFGDGSPHSDLRSPVHLYDIAGNYDAVLTWSLPTGDNYVATTFIEAKEAPDPPPLPPSPPTGSILINAGESYTRSRYLALSVAASPSVTEMCFRQTPPITPPWLWSIWEPYSPFKSYKLVDVLGPDGRPVDGTRTVYVKFRDATLLESGAYPDTIVLDTTPPTGTVEVNGGSDCTDNPTVNVAFSATDNYQGSLQMSWAVDTLNGIIIWTLFGPVQSSVTTSLGSTDGEKYVYVRYRDGAGNMTHEQARIVLDTTPPESGSIIATPGILEIKLWWGDFSDSSGVPPLYRLYCSTEGYPTPSSESKIYEGNEPGFVHKGLKSGVTYYYAVHAVDCAGHVSSLATASGIPRSALPALLHLLLLDD